MTAPANTEIPDSPEEEVANAATHGLGILVSLISIPFVVYSALRYSDSTYIWAIAAYGIGLLMVYTSSTLYHLAKDKDTKRRMRIFDHVSIFFLIAGTHTPIVIKYLPAKTAAIFLGIMWSIVAIGSVLKIFFTGRFEWVSLGLYLLLGWMAVFIIKPLVTNMPSEIFWWILGGGLAYTSGIIFYRWEKLKYHHAIWHCFVLGGSIAHFVAVYLSIPVTVKF